MNIPVIKAMVKSLNDIAKTLDENDSCIHYYVGETESGDHSSNQELIFSEEMQKLCGTEIEVVKRPDGSYGEISLEEGREWNWHPDWLELAS